MGETYIAIQQGDPVVAEPTITFLGTGSDGNPTAFRRLVYPSGVSPLLAPIVYSMRNDGISLNPTRWLNFDTQPLFHPRTNPILTLGGTRVVRHELGIEDVIVTEIWEAPRGASMPTFFFRLLLEYLWNPPPYSLSQTDYIVWEPRDRTTSAYNVELLSLQAGTGSGESQFDVADVIGDGRTPPAEKEYDDALANLNATPTGLITEEVRLRMRIVSEVS